MGATSNTAKQRWNSNHYSQVKISVPPELAANFKEKCKVEGVSIASKLSDFMRLETSGKHFPRPVPLPYETRAKRRIALNALIGEIEAIAEGEQEYMDRIPENLRNSQRYEEAEETVETLMEALSLLAGAY
jgi:hypothetical protein